MINLFKDKKLAEGKFGTGASRAPIDKRNRVYDIIASVGEPVDWNKGYDVEKELNFKIPFKNQNGSSSCVGQATSYYAGVLEKVETGNYNEMSAKGIYSQIFLSGGGAYINSAMSLGVKWGFIPEKIVPSYDKGTPPKEAFTRDLSWKNEEADKIAKVFQSKEYRTIEASSNMDLFAMAIRDNYGVVSGVDGTNNQTWNTLEPKPGSIVDWRHALYFGKFGIDEKGKYISTPNSWGNRFAGEWQKLREDYFAAGKMFDVWTLLDKPNCAGKVFRLVTMADNPAKTVWWIGADGIRRAFLTANQYRESCKALGFDEAFGGLETLSLEEISAIAEGESFVIIK